MSTAPAPLSADDLANALMTSVADNPNRIRGTRHWLGEYGGVTLQLLLHSTQQQQRLWAPLGVPDKALTLWATPLVTATEYAVSHDETPDQITRHEQHIESDYAARLKSVVARLTQPFDRPLTEVTAAVAENASLTLDKQTCHWACATASGQQWLLWQIMRFRELEWQYYSSGHTHLSALKHLLYSLFEVVSGKTLSDPDKQPYRRKDENGEWRDSDEDYLASCADRLLALLKNDAFDVRRFATESPCARLGASEWETVPGSEMYSVKLRHYPRPAGVKANGKTLYLATPMINRCELFDLAPGKSVIEAMLKQGYDIYMVDYGNPGADQSELGLDFYGQTVHDRYLQLVLERHPQQDINVMAYCMGGTLFLPYLARRIEEAQLAGTDIKIRQLALLTTPALFDDEDSGHGWMRDIIRQSYNEFGMRLFYGHSNVSPYAISSGMYGIQPGVEESTPEGFFSRADHPGAIEDAGPFLKWLYSGTRFPAKAHRQWIRRVYMDNQIWRGEYCMSSIYPELDGKPADMDKIAEADIDIFDYCGLRDPIAPAGSCRSSERWGRVKTNQRMVGDGLNRTIEKNIGHIFVVSRKLLAEFLDAVTDFLDDEPPAYRPAAGTSNKPSVKSQTADGRGKKTATKETAPAKNKTTQKTKARAKPAAKRRSAAPDTQTSTASEKPAPDSENKDS
tara:strand:+ start:57096 stop:59138 length:2043 start_codon:yes stop_codon:yes gene_type:complete